jgi:hypothetical protein
MELQARKARAKAEAVLTPESKKVTANIDHVLGDTPPAGPLDLGSLLPLLAGRPGRRTIIIVEDQ